MAQLKTVENSIKNMKMLKDLKYMEMTDTFTNTYQTNIQKMKSSLTSVRLNLLLLDIEVASEQGFPDVESCVEEILAITIQDYTTKQIITWGVKPFNNKQDNVTYHCCHTERKPSSIIHRLLDEGCSRCNYWMEHTTI